MFLIYFHSCLVMNIKLFLNVRCCHIPFVLRDCKNLFCICSGTKREVIIFTNPSARAGYDTRSIFKQSLAGLNSVFLLLD